MSGELFGSGEYDPGKLVGNMRLSESEIIIAAKFAGINSEYDKDYPSLEEGVEVNFQTITSESAPGTRFRLIIDTLVGGVTRFEQTEETIPPCKSFEATVVESDRELVKPGEEVFGIFFPVDDFAVFVDTAPDSGATDRKIGADILLAEAGKL